MKSIPTYAIVIAAVVLLAMIVAVVIVVIVQRRRKAAAAKAAAVSASGEPDVGDAIRAAFATTEAKLKLKVATDSIRNAIPRLLVLGEPGSGKTTLLGATLLNTALDKAGDPRPGDKAPVNIWSFDHALVIDPRGDLFLTPAGEEPEPPAGLDALIGVLKSTRPARPIDGILLSIPCTDLDPHGGGNDEDRKRKATTLHKQIGDIQRKLGMSVPIYTLVTKCDTLPSFQSFGQEIQLDQRQGILGWSRRDAAAGPVAAARAKDPIAHDYVGDALESLEQRLLQRQVVRFLAESGAPAQAGARLGAADGLFLFPTELRLIAPALRVYIDEIFVPSVYDEPFLLRGIYFCGDGGRSLQGAPASALVNVPPAAVATSSPRGVIFVRALFAEKIIPEANLARPSEGATRSRGRLILGLQIGAVALGLLFGVALTLEFERLRTASTSLMPCLTAVRHDLSMQKDHDAAAETADQRRDQAVELLDTFSAIRTEGMASPIIPASVLRVGRGLDVRLEGAIELGYERVILTAFKAKLEEREGRLSNPEPPISHGPNAPLNLETSPEFAQLDRWLLQVALFDREVGRYNRLATHPRGSAAGGEATPAEQQRESESRLQDVGELAEYLLTYKAEPSFYQDAHYYRQLLAHGVDLSQFQSEERPRQAVVDKCDVLFGRLFDEMLQIYKDRVIRGDLHELERGFRLIEAGVAGGLDVEGLRNLRRALDNTETDLAEPLLAWVPSKVPPDNQGLERLFETVSTSKLLGADEQRSLRDSADQRLRLLQHDIEIASTEITGPLLKHKDGNLQMALADEAVTFKKPLDDLLAERFMAAGEGGVLPSPDDYMSWDVEQLKDAAALVKDYDAFDQAGQFKHFRGITRDATQDAKQAAQSAVTDLAQQRLRYRLIDRTSRAVVHGMGQLRGAPLAERTRADVENVRLASPPLREILAAFVRFHWDDDRDRLRDVVRAQGSRLLKDAYGVLQSRRLYEVRGGSFSWWDTIGTPAFDAFGVTDAAGLTEYVAAERTTADATGKEFAEPVISLLESAEVGAALNPTEGMGTWRGVIGPLRDYEAKKPGNGVSVLERFMLTELPTVKLDNCLALTRTLNGRATDFFTAKKRQIVQLLRDRCDVRSGQTIEARYFDLWRTFNTQLAGRFPFAKPDANTQVDDAPPEAVREFLAREADFNRTYSDELHRRGSLGQEDARRAARFLDDMEKVRLFLEPMWLQADSADDGAFDVKVDFRANPGHEVGGNEIAEWLMYFPEERLTLGGAKQVAHWRIGDSARIALRWAKNSPDMPTSRQDNGGVVRERLVTFDSRGTWAILRLISSYQSTVRDPAGAVDPFANYLLLKVQTAPDPSGGFLDRVGADSGNTRVFVRLQLSGADKKKLPKYPDFPVLAPAL